MNREDNPKVFITYSWSSQHHKNWIREEIAERLVHDGVDVILDQWDLKEGNDSYEFMEQMVNNPNISKVLIISDKLYTDKSNKKRGGVGTEAQIITPEIYSKSKQEKFIPIIKERDENGEPYLPTYLKGRIYFDFCNEQIFGEEYEKLVRNIFNKPLLKKPSIGTPPDYILSDEKIQIKTKYKVNEVLNAINENKKNKNKLIKDFLYLLSESLEDFRLNFKNNNLPFDEIIYDNIQNFLPYRDDFVKVVDLIYSVSPDNQIDELFFEFFEKILKYKYFWPMNESYTYSHFDNYNFILYELFIYFITSLINNHQYGRIYNFLNNYYYLDDNITRNNGKDKEKYYIFYSRINSFEDERKTRLKKYWFSITAKEFEDRATIPNYGFRRLMQTDFILFLKSILFLEEEEDIEYIRWYPCLVKHAEITSNFELFLRADSRKYFSRLNMILGLKNVDDLISKWEKAKAQYNEQFKRFQFDYHTSFSKLLNIENIIKNRDQLL